MLDWGASAPPSPPSSKSASAKKKKTIRTLTNGVNQQDLKTKKILHVFSLFFQVGRKIKNQQQDIQGVPSFTIS
jgi:hypothetical protein